MTNDTPNPLTDYTTEKQRRDWTNNVETRDIYTSADDADDWLIQGCKIIAHGATVVIILAILASLLSLFSPRSN